MTNFQSMDLPEGLNCTLHAMGFKSPTPIQAKVIPLALEGKDILGSAQTGTGKTGAFGIPLVAHLLTENKGTALVLTPTRELAVQVLTQLQHMLGKKSNVKTALLIGGEFIKKQFHQLREKPRLIVGTPGRVNDHLKRKTLLLADCNFLVLDETDRMLDMGFSVQIDEILKFMPNIRQTLLFSATLPKNIEKIAEKYLNNPIRVAMTATLVPAANIKQDIVRVRESEKYPSLVSELEGRAGSVIVFVKTKQDTEMMAKRLSKEGFGTNAIHGDLRQHKRQRVINDFKKMKYRILVATDVAARGLDIPHIEHVINYDLPQCAEDYIHRIGRTARAGAAGSALCFVAPSDKFKWLAIERILNPKKEKSFKPKAEFKKTNNKKPRRKKNFQSFRERQARTG